MPDIVETIQNDLKKLGNPAKVPFLQKFFRTREGEYAEGDILIGVTVPNQRAVAKKYRGKVNLNVVLNLLHSEIHEYRLTSLFLLIDLYEREKDPERKQQYVDFYIDNLDWVNNWDLVDSSAHKILGDSLRGQKDKKILRTLAKSGHLWRERVAVVANWTIMKDDEFTEMLWLAKHFLTHEHDLIHKAVGWMLREMGKRDETLLKEFLDEHAHEMPRTMLRYAIEKFDEKTRKHYLNQKQR